MSRNQPTPRALFVRIPPGLYDALKAHAEANGWTLQSSTTHLLTEALVQQEVVDQLPGEILAYLQGRKLMAMLAGFLEAAAQPPAGDPEPAGDPPPP